MKKALFTLLAAASFGSTQAQIGPDPGFEGPEAYVTNYMCAKATPTGPVILYTGFGYINIADEKARCARLGGDQLFYGPPPG